MRRNKELQEHWQTMLDNLGNTIAERRARLVVRCARDLLGTTAPLDGTDLHLSLSVQEFEFELRERYAREFPDLVFRTDSTLERARLERAKLPDVPRVILRRGAPPAAQRARSQR